jgi:UDP-MurNAc hydroxylase
MSTATRITGVNHASYILETSGAVLMTDPWFAGTVFDNGWGLYSPTTIDECLLRRVSHIWISHEHPDHFSPSTLRSLPQEVRERITVLFQASRDRKVVDHCRELGFGEVRELRANDWIQLSDELRVMCNPWRLGDSYLVADTPAGLVLNVNDCVIRTPREAESILEDLGCRSPQVLLTQYSYANRFGNPDETEVRQAAARAELESVVTQISVLRPKFVVPLASFMWFCHEENGYLNDSMSTATDAVRVIRDRTDSLPVVLYPGESWALGDEPLPADISATRYDADLAARLRGPHLTAVSERVPLDTLIREGRAFADDLRLANGSLRLATFERLGRLRPVIVWVADLDRALTLSRHGLALATARADECDIVLNSEALEFLLRYRFGGSTLFSNGRFSAPAAGHLERIYPLINLRDVNNRGVGVVGWFYGRLKHRVERSLPVGSRVARWLRSHR